MNKSTCIHFKDKENEIPIMVSVRTSKICINSLTKVSKIMLIEKRAGKLRNNCSFFCESRRSGPYFGSSLKSSSLLTSSSFTSEDSDVMMSSFSFLFCSQNQNNLKLNILNPNSYSEVNVTNLLFTMFFGNYYVYGFSITLMKKNMLRCDNMHASK